MGVLDSLPTHVRTTGEQAIARSRMVKRLRLALPIFALILIAAFIFNTGSRTVDPTFLEDFQQVQASTDELRMANPRFAGIDGQGRPFEITADAAKQNPGNRDVVELDMPRAIQGRAGEETLVTADKGVYRTEANILELSNSVRLEHEIGADIYVLRSPEATVSIKDEVVTSNAGILGASQDGGSLKADHMKAYKADGRVVFEGNVSMRIFPKSAEKKIENDTGPPLKDVEITEPQ